MTKEKMLEKIREKVILANNPECKTLEDALREEVKNSSTSVQCQFVLTDNDNCIVNGDYVAKYYHHNNNYKILGLPLTFERILVALKMYKNIQPLISYDKNNLMSISIIKEQTISEIIRIGIISNHLFSWQPNQTLDNQSKEIIRADYNILCND